MHRLLADEPLHIQPQLIILDQWQRLLEDLDEEFLAGGQQQVQHVEHMGGQRLVGNVMKRQVRPVELDIASLENETLVVGGTRFSRVRPHCAVIDGEHKAPLPWTFTLTHHMSPQ